MICSVCEFPTENPTVCVCGRRFCTQCQLDHTCDATEIVEAEPGSVTMRDYQEEAHRKVRDEFAGGARATLVVMPTGTGKTILFAELIRRWTGYSS